MADDNGKVNTPLSFDEPDDSFTPRAAIAEAKRCLNCKNPVCRTGCPIEHEIPQFIAALAKGNVGEASTIIARRSNLPAVCGRVCPHEKQCEGACILAKKGNGIRIGKLEQFIADFDSEMELTAHTPPSKFVGKVAVIGSGPAGLTVAGDLAKASYEVTVFESQAEPGGVLVYGIPDFRLKKDVVRREIRRIERLGVKFNTDILVGPDITVDEIFAEGYDAIFIGTGTALPRTLDVPGRDLPGVLQASYFLQMVALARADNVDRREVPVQLGDRVFVIGAGNVGMDAARTAIRLGARASVVYHRTEKEITALLSEYQQAREEGVEFIWLASTKQFLGQNKLTGLEYEVMEIDNDKEIRGTGRLETINADKVILAIGQRPAARIVSTTTGIQVNEKGYVITKDRPYGMTTRRGVFAGGDVVHEPATVVLAMKEAKKVAQGIALYIEAKKLLEECGE
ncbi:NAD(P)-dependent oxidoreductase [Sporomusa malonica]|uniref:Glutamate synthase (NADPH/NADH) small chain n=1 Tax=Sporomusa malonica TaxID=112901 RepID=A0A1W2CPE8_9FIRM|nr:NAD(P)-dependent oxidoreductase [Sporomusa malonica]SMC86854.1 glutamate synthase (NADPH/NADH) small chain [Sporomusa malonica]